MTDEENDPIVIPLLAVRFLGRLMEHLGPPAFMRACRLNKQEKHLNVCHSHDECDANEVMADAWGDVVGADMDPANERDARRWNAAWAAARRMMIALVGE